MGWGGAAAGLSFGGAILDAIQRIITKVLVDPIINILQGLMSLGMMWSFHALVRMSPNEALWTVRKIVDSYFVLPVEWAGFIAEYLERMTGSKIDLNDIVKEGVGIGSTTAMQALGKKFLDPMLGLIMPTPEEARTNPMGGADRFMSANLQFQMSAWLLHLLGDTMSFGMFKSLKDLPNAISWSYGIGWLSWMVMGPVFKAGINDPMTKEFNKYYRPNLLSQAQIIDSFFAGRKTAEEAHSELALLGFSDKDIETLLNISRRRLTMEVIDYLASIGKIKTGPIIQYYRDQGLSQEDAEAMAEMHANKRKRALEDKIITKMEGLFKAGSITEAQLRQYYVNRGYDQEEQDLAIMALTVEGTQTGELSDSEICRLYQNGKMPLEEAKRRLLTRYTDSRDVDLLLELYPPKEKAEALITPRELTPSEIGKLYNLGKIDYDEAFKKLTTRTPPVANADLFLLLYERGDEPGATQLLKGITPAQIGSLYKDGVLSEEEAINRLKALNYPEEEALLFLTLYVPAPPPAVPAPPKLSAAQVGKLWKNRELTDEEANSRLMAYFKDANEVALFLKLYSPQVVAIPPVLPVLTPSQVGRLWQTGELLLPELTTRLYAVFGDYNEVRLFRLLYPSKVPKETVGAWYQIQKINREEAEARLIDLNMTEDEITAYLASISIS